MSMSSEEENHRKNVEDKAEMGRKKRAIWERKWRRLDIVKAFASFFVHFLCLLAPFNFTWPALRVALVVYTVGGLGITVSYHRNLAHRSFKVPKWLEYLFAYCGLLAIQGDPIDWVSTHRYHHQFTDSDRDPHSPKEGFWFSHLLWLFDTGYLVEKGIGVAMEHHVTCCINSLCHIWGSRTWKTNDTSRNVWWLSVFSFGESWHNNHHAFESSARQGLEWWQIDISWYIVRFLEIIGLATDVKLPSESQRRRMALVR
ncbi:hypothetical protein Bca101_095707 [Brassica carinata]